MSPTGSALSYSSTGPSPTPKTQKDYSQLFDGVKQQAKTFYFDEYDNASANGAKLGAFIILFAGMNYLISLMHGKADNTESEFKRFCENYMPNYDKDALYKSFRCGFAHRCAPQSGKIGVSGAATKSIILTHNHPEQHLYVDNNVVTLNLENFRSDLETALSDMMRDAASGSTRPKGRSLAENMAYIHKNIGPMVK